MQSSTVGCFSRACHVLAKPDSKLLTTHEATWWGCHVTATQLHVTTRQQSIRSGQQCRRKHSTTDPCSLCVLMVTLPSLCAPCAYACQQSALFSALCHSHDPGYCAGCAVLPRQMDANLKGCFVYTSSASAVLPSPFAVTYASTKAFLSMFAISLAPEVKWLGIDVLAVHPSPVASR